jgi:hypothetical protein
MTKRTVERISTVIVGAIVWYIIFWYFMLPDTPYTFKDANGTWMEIRNQFPYSSANTLSELPALLQQAYIVGFILVIGGILVLDLIVTWIRSLFA